MKLKPVRTHNAKYPDKYSVDLNRLLLTYKPNRWKTSQAVALLLCALTVTQLTGCKASDQTTGNQSTVRKMNMAPIFKGIPVASKQSFWQQKAVIIPLGNNPGPGFSVPLTEEAAQIIIQEELKNHGINSEPSKKKVFLNNNSKSESWSFDLNISGAKESVYAEFIPFVDAEPENELAERKALNLPEDSKSAAYSLREQLCEVNDQSTGVIFYTNGATFSPTANLREQVNEFVTWLKTSGLI